AIQLRDRLVSPPVLQQRDAEVVVGEAAQPRGALETQQIVHGGGGPPERERDVCSGATALRGGAGDAANRPRRRWTARARDRRWLGGTRPRRGSPPGRGLRSSRARGEHPRAGPSG